MSCKNRLCHYFEIFCEWEWQRTGQLFQSADQLFPILLQRRRWCCWRLCYASLYLRGIRRHRCRTRIIQSVIIMHFRSNIGQSWIFCKTSDSICTLSCSSCSSYCDHYSPSLRKKPLFLIFDGANRAFKYSWESSHLRWRCGAIFSSLRCWNNLGMLWRNFTRVASRSYKWRKTKQSLDD